jgi:3-hydroxyacyl-CoA dehydrogenase/enoyl-CoA hydratase/carnithine racemase
MTRTTTVYLDHAGLRFAVLTLASSDKRPATLSPDALTDLQSALHAMDLSGVDAVALTGSGPVFCAGADLAKMTQAATTAQAEEVARQGLEALSEFAGLPVPTFAFINGTALGGGLELALHADYRTAADSVGALGFPEVRLGLIPGWGGIPRTLALLGPEQTARMVVTDSLAGKYLSAPRAAECGLIDAVVPDGNFLAASLDFAAGVLSGAVTRPVRVNRSAESSKAALESVRNQLDARLHGAAPAPYRALELIAVAGVDRHQTAEVQAFGELLLSDEARASIYAFWLTQTLAKKPAGRPHADPLLIRTVGVIGAGLMASQLALVFAQQLRVPVRITDLSQERIDKALQWIGGQLDKLVRRGRLGADEALALLSLVTGSTDKADFADCDVVIEAVFEDLEVKRTVFAELEPLLRPEALLLTNTSSLSVDALGAGLAHPERLIGFHFFNPVAVMPLVEIITASQTNNTTLATAFDLAQRLRKSGVVTKDTAGFVVNRVLTRLFDVVLSMLDDGAEPRTVDHALDPFGLPMTPLQLLQFIGPGVQLHICQSMHEAYPQRFGVSNSLAKLVAAGLPGYLDGGGQIDPAAAEVLPESRPVSAEKVRAEILGALADEVKIILDESVVAGPEQVDLCMILGANYPFHTGGLTPLLDREAGTAFHPELRVSVLTDQ